MKSQREPQSSRWLFAFRSQLKISRLLLSLIVVNILLVVLFFCQSLQAPDPLGPSVTTITTPIVTANTGGLAFETGQSHSLAQPDRFPGLPQASISSANEITGQTSATNPAVSGQNRNPTQSGNPSGAAWTAANQSEAQELRDLSLGTPGVEARGASSDDSSSRVSPLRTLTTPVNSTAAGNFLVSNGQRVSVESAATSQDGTLPNELNVVITPETSALGNPAGGTAPLGSAASSDLSNEVFTHAEELFRAKWGWQAFDSARRTTWQPAN